MNRPTTELLQQPDGMPARAEFEASNEMLRALSIVIPAFNEELGLPSVLDALERHAPGAEIIVIDDGSSDRSAELASKHTAVTVLRHRKNRGYGAAIKTGTRSASRDYVCWYDADGQHQPGDMLRVVERLHREKHDAVIGVRQGRIREQIHRRPARLALHILMRLVTGQDVSDINSGLRAFRREVLLRYLHLLPDGFSASTTTTFILCNRGCSLAEIPISVRERVGTSSVRVLSHGFLTFRLVIRLIMLFDPWKVFTIGSLLQLSIGMAYGLSVAFRHERGFPVLAAILIISGVLTFFMGLIADQIAELRKERFENVDCGND